MNGCGGKKVEGDGCDKVREVVVDPTNVALEQLEQAIDAGEKDDGITDDEAEILRLNGEIKRMRDEFIALEQHHDDVHGDLETAIVIIEELSDEIVRLEAANKDLNRVMCPLVRAYRAIRRFFGKKNIAECTEGSCSVQG